MNELDQEALAYCRRWAPGGAQEDDHVELAKLLATVYARGLRDGAEKTSGTGSRLVPGSGLASPAADEHRPATPDVSGAHDPKSADSTVRHFSRADDVHCARCTRLIVGTLVYCSECALPDQEDQR